jgi:DNA-binding NtrC family response regulator
MSRVLIIGSHTPISREIGRALTAAHMPMAYSAGPADALKRLRARRFDVVITSADSDIEENLALLEEMRSIRPDLKCIVLAQHSTPDKVIAALKARVFGCFT